MKIIYGPKGCGKTDDMLIWLMDGWRTGKPRILIVLSDSRKLALTTKLQKLWETSGHQAYVNNAANSIYSVGDIRRLGHRIKQGTEVGILDADTMLEKLLGIDRPDSIWSVTGATQGTIDLGTTSTVEPNDGTIPT